MWHSGYLVSNLSCSSSLFSPPPPGSTVQQCVCTGRIALISTCLSVAPPSSHLIPLSTSNCEVLISKGDRLIDRIEWRKKAFHSFKLNEFYTFSIYFIFVYGNLKRRKFRNLYGNRISVIALYFREKFLSYLRSWCMMLPRNGEIG